MERVVFEAFVMAEGHLCITYGRILDAEVAFGHDKSHLRRDKYHFYIFMRKPLLNIFTACQLKLAATNTSGSTKKHGLKKRCEVSIIWKSSLPPGGYFHFFLPSSAINAEIVMRERMLKFIEKNELLPTGSKTLIAASAGLDSTVLCHLFREAGLEFGVAHCNFQLRGTASDEDEQFVKILAGELGVPFFSIKFKTEEYARSAGQSIQMAARELRYDWLRDIAREAGYQKIATAHHLNDSVETVLYNFAKGCGIRGLHGILPDSEGLIRPLLFATKIELEEYARKHQINFREDASNLTDKYARNKIRHRVVPVLEELNPSFLQNAGETIQRMREAESVYHLFFEQLRDAAVNGSGGTVVIDKNKLRFPGTQTTVLYEMLRPYGFNGGQAAQIGDRMWGQPGAIFHSPTHRLLVERENLVLEPLGQPVAEGVTVGEDLKTVRLPGGEFHFTLKQKPPATFPDDPNVAWFDYDRLTFPLKLRHWQPGDVFQPLGMNGRHQKLQDFFSNHKLSRFAKDRVWILESNGEICWVAGLRPDERVKVTPGTVRCLEARIIPSAFANDNNATSMITGS
jgi:tRNA(Ile)-lysidine synthase